MKKEKILLFEKTGEYRCPKKGEHFIGIRSGITTAAFDFFETKHDILNRIVADVKVSKDGNQFCYLYGEDLKVGIAGFGDTKELAREEFLDNWRKEKL